MIIEAGEKFIVTRGERIKATLFFPDGNVEEKPGAARSQNIYAGLLFECVSNVDGCLLSKVVGEVGNKYGLDMSRNGESFVIDSLEFEVFPATKEWVSHVLSLGKK